MGDPSISKGAVVEALRIVAAAKFTGDDNAFKVLASALQRHMDLTAHAKASWDRAAALSAQIEASKAELIAEVEAWMSDALIELPSDAIDLDRILAKHRGQP